MTSSRWVKASFLSLISLSFTLAFLIFVSGCTSGEGALAHAVKEVEGVSNSSSFQESDKKFHYQLTAVSSVETAQHASTPAPIVLRGRGTTGRLVDRQGNIVMTASQYGSVYGLGLSPDHKHALVYFGGATYKVVSSETLEDVANPPQYPPIDDDVTGFRWFFLDNTHLFGLSQLRSTDVEGRMASEIDSLIPIATLTYVYALNSGTLMPVEIDDTLPPVFSMEGVSSGYITLLSFDDEFLGATVIRTPER